MKDAQILQKVIEKARTNGWKFPLEGEPETTLNRWKVIDAVRPYLSVFWDLHAFDSFDADTSTEYKYIVPEIIFNHEFAKALWGTEPEYQIFGDMDELHPYWEYKLVCMVLEENPLKYLESEI